jgi:chromosomal replication initiation ATPase DnaA
MAGKIFGKNHATAIHARDTVNNLIETDRNFRGRLETVLRHIEKINAKFGFELK